MVTTSVLALVALRVKVSGRAVWTCALGAPAVFAVPLSTCGPPEPTDGDLYEASNHPAKDQEQHPEFAKDLKSRELEGSTADHHGEAAQPSESTVHSAEA